jgi:hypothetical protein
MKQTEMGNRIALYPVPRFRRRNGTAKIQIGKGSRVEKFPRHLRKFTTRPLRIWIGGTVGRERQSLYLASKCGGIFYCGMLY